MKAARFPVPWRGTLVLIAFLAAFAAALAPAPQAAAAPKPHVYLLRGFLDLFSIGLDGVGEELRQRGVDATVHNYAEWSSLADSAAAAWRERREGPIVLVGHSAGGAAVVYMAKRLSDLGVPVALVIALDPRGGEVIDGDVRQVVNLYFGNRSPMQAAPGFSGTLENLNISGIAGVDHMNVDDHSEIHAIIVGYVLRALASR